MGQPYGIAFGRDGMYAVVDYSHNCVWIFDRQDQLVRKFGSTGTGNGQFSSPYGVAFDDNNYLYVTDCCDRVQKFKISCLSLDHFNSVNIVLCVWGPNSGGIFCNWSDVC